MPNYNKIYLHENQSNIQSMILMFSMKDIERILTYYHDNNQIRKLFYYFCGSLDSFIWVLMFLAKTGRSVICLKKLMFFMIYQLFFFNIIYSYQ